MSESARAIPADAHRQCRGAAFAIDAISDVRVAGEDLDGCRERHDPCVRLRDRPAPAGQMR